jgi:hypothetical protein
MDVDVAVFASWDLELEAAGNMEPQLFGVDLGYVEKKRIMLFDQAYSVQYGMSKNRFPRTQNLFQLLRVCEEYVVKEEADIHNRF